MQDGCGADSIISVSTPEIKSFLQFLLFFLQILLQGARPFPVVTHIQAFFPSFRPDLTGEKRLHFGRICVIISLEATEVVTIFRTGREPARAVE